MKAIELECYTRGHKPGAIIKVGTGEGEISLADATVLVTERMAKAFMGPVSSEDVQRVAELEGQVTDLTARNGELKEEIEHLNEYVESLKGQVTDLTARNGELEGQLALLAAPPATGAAAPKAVAPGRR